MASFVARFASSLSRHPRLRWGVPAWVIVIVVAVATGMFSANAKSKPLAPRSAAQLLADVESSSVAGLSGTVVAKMSLGLPELPQIGGAPTGSTLLSLLAGSHTARVWYAGQAKQRLALIDPLGETDLFRNGNDLWSWSSATRSATHTTLDAATKGLPPSPVPLTPEQLASRALSEIDPTTQVTTDSDRQIAGRAAYELVLTPRDPATRIGSVRLAVDAQNKVPLAVEVYARNHPEKAALDVAFTQVTFGVPDESNFAWTPPKGVVVSNNSGASARAGEALAAASRAPTVIGAGWTAVFAIHAELPTGFAANMPNTPSPTVIPSATPSVVAAPSADKSAKTGGPSKTAKPAKETVKGRVAEKAIGQAIDSVLTPQSGAWGTGRLFTSSLLSVLVTDDGRVLLGAVDPERLFAAALTYK